MAPALARCELIQVGQHEAVHALSELAVDAERGDADPSGQGRLRIVLVQRGDWHSDLRQGIAQGPEVLLPVTAAELGGDFLEVFGPDAERMAGSVNGNSPST
jgi:hypothetical protein